MAPRNRMTVRPSTLRFFRAGRDVRGFTLLKWIHGYFYGRWPYLYIGIGTGEHRLYKRFAKPALRLFRKPEGIGDLLSQGTAGKKHAKPDKSKSPSFADTYHGKVISLKTARRLVTLDREIRLPNLEKVIPYALAKDLIIQNPDHIVLMECPCRASRPNPCKPLDVCLIVGEPFAGFIAEHHPNRSRRITQEEASAVLRAEKKRGHVHHAFFKDAMMGRFYAICSCCSCCCGAIQAHRNGIPMLASSGYLASFDPSRCTGCGDCSDVCVFSALTMKEGRAVLNPNRCLGCGNCAFACREGAVRMARAPEKGVPLELSDLLESTDGLRSNDRR